MMARIFIDGFEHGDPYLWDSGYPSIDSSAPITGTYSAEMATIESLGKNVPPNDVYYIAFNFGLSPYGDLRVRFLSNSTLQGWVSIGRTSDQICVHNGAEGGGFESAYSYDYSSDTLCIGIRFENKNASDKNIKVWLNNFEVLDVDYTNSSPDATTTNFIQLKNKDTFGVDKSYVDDVVIDDSVRPKNMEVHGLTPNADSTPLQWTPSSGESHYEMVDEQYGHASYGYADEWIQSKTDGHTDLFGMSDLPYGDQDIRSVQVQAYGSTGNVSGETYKPSVKVSGELHYGSSGEESLVLFHYSNYIWDDNPATSGEWTVSDVDGLEAGVVSIL